MFPAFDRQVGAALRSPLNLTSSSVPVRGGRRQTEALKVRGRGSESLGVRHVNHRRGGISPALLSLPMAFKLLIDADQCRRSLIFASDGRRAERRRR